jgi:uncharacterized membrane protein
VGFIVYWQPKAGIFAASTIQQTMSILIKILLILHVAGGITTLMSGPIAIFFNWNNTKAHRAAGKIFFIAMLVVCFSSILTFARHPEKVFYQFLFGLAFVVLAQLVRGVRAIFLMKRRPVLPLLDYGLLLTSLAAGVGMVGMSVYLLRQPELLPFTILFGVFGSGSIADGIKWWQHLRKIEQIQPMKWLELHTSSMIGSFIASTTAFTVNVAHFLPWYAQWFGPTVLLVPVSIYFGKKIRARTNLVVNQSVAD